MLICHRCNKPCGGLFWSDHYETDVCSACSVIGIEQEKEERIIEASMRKEEYRLATLSGIPVGKHSLLGIRLLIRAISNRLHKISKR